MSLKLDDMIAKIGADLIRPSLYHVMIGNNDFNLFAHTVQLPSRMIQTRPDQNYIVGRTINQAYATDISGHLSISFYLNHDGPVKKSDTAVYFQNWMAGTDSTSVIDNPAGGVEPQMARYFEDYAKDDIKIIQYDRTGQAIMTWVCYKVFPLNVTYDQLSYSSVDSIQGITVEFDVEDFIIEEQGSSSSSSGVGSSSVASLVSSGGSGVLKALDNLTGGTVSNFATNLVSGKFPDLLSPTEWQNPDEQTSFLDDIKSNYSAAKSAVTGFARDITNYIDPDVLSAAKKLAAVGVRNAINGIPTDFTQEMKRSAAPAIGNIVARLSDDPTVKNNVKRQVGNVVQGMPDRVTGDARRGAISDINQIINSL